MGGGECVTMELTGGDCWRDYKCCERHDSECLKMGVFWCGNKVRRCCLRE